MKFLSLSRNVVIPDSKSSRANFAQGFSRAIPFLWPDSKRPGLAGRSQHNRDAKKVRGVESRWMFDCRQGDQVEVTSGPDGGLD